MNKKGNNPYLIIGILVVALLILGGYISLDFAKKDYSLQNVEPEVKNLKLGESTRIFFDVLNKADLTFLGKVEIIVNETCFSKSDEQVLSEVQPNSQIRSSIYLRTESNYAGRLDSCIGKPYEITLKLKDVSGKILDEKAITIGIVGS